MERISRGLLTLALVCVLVALSARNGSAEVVDRIVAEVNDEVITMSELQKASKSIEEQEGISPKGKEDKGLEHQMLETLIDRKLAKAEAKRRGIKVDDKELNEALENFKKQNHLPDEDSFNKALTKAGLTLAEIKEKIADQLTQERLLSMTVGLKAVVSESQVRQFYDEKYKAGGTQLHLLTIKIPYPPGATEAQQEEVKKQAENIFNAVKGGATFQDAAQKYSLTATDVGFVPENELDPKLSQFLGKLSPKEVAPVVTPQGIQLIQLLERRSGQAQPYEEVAPQIRRMLTQKEMEKQFSVWVKTLRENAHIKIML
ncbi:MAG: SurA N-terminal domain-containing protein [Desulfobaccales bacterium]|jgi:peptidyl-prolyl cis-trans isomerase SurA